MNGADRPFYMDRNISLFVNDQTGPMGGPMVAS